MNKKVQQLLSDYFRTLGHKGGSVKSERKSQAIRLNALKWCKGCGASVTATDRRLGQCTQCGYSFQKQQP
jgi:hypothetical protein